MSLLQENLTDEQIIASAIIVDDKDTEAPPHASHMAFIFNELSRHFGKKVYVVRWPNGITASVDADPSKKESWNNLLVAIYRHDPTGYHGGDGR